jgi:MHS family citrate/tricarballylate:H+ symporter-like MFS transporter
MTAAVLDRSAPVSSKVGAVLRVTSGNFLEQFDFFLFGFYASDIAKTFFPNTNEFASLMSTFAAFGAGFLMRPLGAIILGAYIDEVGRRKGLIVTLALMASGTILIAFVPGYATIGLLAPFLVLVGRLLQGFSAGAELGGVSVYLAEIATPGKKGFYVSWQSASQQVSIIVAAALGFAVREYLTPVQIDNWGWRIPFFVGCLVVPVIFFLRRTLQETEAFQKRTHRPKTPEILRSMVSNWQVVVAGTLMVAMTTTAFYLITVYTPTFGRTVLKLTSRDALIVTFCVGVSNFCWLPIGGTIADRIGRKPLLVASTALTILLAYPMMHWLASAPSFSRMLEVELVLSALYGLYNGAMVVALTEVMPVEVRVVGFSLAYSLATAIFGGFTPAISTWMIHVLDDKAAPGYWLTFAAACGLGATLYLFHKASVQRRAISGIH